MRQLQLDDTPGYLVRRLYSAYADLWREQVGVELTGPQFSLLHEVRDAPGVDQITLAQRIAVDRSTMADMATRLERRGLISRRPGAEDGRKKIIALTAEGRQVLTIAEAAVVTLSDGLLDAIPADQRAVVLHALRVLAADWEGRRRAPVAVSAM